LESESGASTQGKAEADLSLQYLYAELSGLDILIRREVHRWQLAGQDPGDVFRGLYVSDEQAGALLSRPVATNWWHAVTLEPAELELFQNAKMQANQNARQMLEQAHSLGITPRLEHLMNAFALDRFELEILLVCLAPALDLRYERLYGYLQDDVTRKRPSVNLVLDLLCEPGYQRQAKLPYFAKEAPLERHRLLHPMLDSNTGAVSLLSQTLAVDETVMHWLLGNYQPSAGLGTRAIFCKPDNNPEDKLLAGDGPVLIDLNLAQPPLLAFYGPDLSSQQAAGRILASRWGKPLLMVDLAAAKEEELLPAEALNITLRDARLTQAVPMLLGWDVCLEETASAPNLLTECFEYPDLIILAGRSAWQPGGISRERSILWMEFPIPPYHRRKELWKYYLAGHESTGQLDLDGLAGQFSLTSGKIRDAFAAARDMAVQQNRAIRNEDLFTAARHYSNPRLVGLAHKLNPRYSWGDIVLPEDHIAQLREIVATVRGRPIVLDEWGIGRKLASSRGVTILFSGPPGTGKTMSAEVIAGELGLDLFKIDLSTIVSKYIGETEKNLERIFSEAETSNAILFFDEADALFGKRSEVRDSHDRYANIEISYLLQRMEAYDGVTILATNLRSNLDESFTRRLQFAVDFPFPEEAYRLRIWRTLFPLEVPRAPDLDLEWLARRFKLAGGNIRNVIVGAAYLAASDGGQLRMDHLLHSTRRELQKMGRLIGDEDLIVQND
jgi:ATP-dependent 26S proteasome regulatory subunit